MFLYLSLIIRIKKSSLEGGRNCPSSVNTSTEGRLPISARQATSNIISSISYKNNTGTPAQSRTGNLALEEQSIESAIQERGLYDLSATSILHILVLYHKNRSSG